MRERGRHAWIDRGDGRLPEAVRHVDPPFRGCWFSGDASLLERGPRIGIIGSRRPRPDAEAAARRITRDAARAGFTIVSGLAIGVDGLAHRVAVDAGAPTIGVLAGGLGRIHPRTNLSLARRIAGSRAAHGVAPGPGAEPAGLLLSEYGHGDERAYPNRFRERNRIIAALCDYLVVVQALPTSGSMITATCALDLGVPVGLVPSAPDDPAYAGSIELIHDGADAVVDGRSLFKRLELHGVMRRGFADAARRGATVDPRCSGSWLGGGDADQLPLFDHPLASIVQLPRTADEIAELAGMSLSDARRMLVELEEEGAVRHTDDGAWVAADLVS